MRKRTSILLVEDDPDDEELTILAFRQSNIANRIDVVRDGQAVLDWFAAGQSGPELPAVILLDIKLPKIDGLEVLRRLRDQQHTRRIPVVMLTSSRQQEDLVRSYDLGANSFIRKPVDFDKFVEAVKHLEVYWLVLNETPDEGGGYG